MPHDMVTAIHCLDAAAAAARATARAHAADDAVEESERWQAVAVRISGLCAQLVTVAANAGHSNLLTPSDRARGSVERELARAARLLSEVPTPKDVKPRSWAQLVLDVQTVARETVTAPVRPTSTMWGRG
jgi:hypothetical protein